MPAFLSACSWPLPVSWSPLEFQQNTSHRHRVPSWQACSPQRAGTATQWLHRPQPPHLTRCLGHCSHRIVSARWMGYRLTWLKERILASQVAVEDAFSDHRVGKSPLPTHSPSRYFCICTACVCTSVSWCPGPEHRRARSSVLCFSGWLEQLFP